MDFPNPVLPLKRYACRCGELEGAKIMKKNVLLVLMCLFAISTYAKKETTSVTFNVALDCENCIKKVESNIAFEKGVKALECSIKDQTVTVSYLDNKTNVENLKKGFAKIGYENITVKEPCCATKTVKDDKKEAVKGGCCTEKSTQTR